MPLQINSICSPGIDIFSFTKFLISATVSCRTSREVVLGWNAQRLGMWRYNHCKDSEWGLWSQPDKHEAATSSHQVFVSLVTNTHHEVLGPSTNGKPMLSSTSLPASKWPEVVSGYSTLLLRSWSSIPVASHALGSRRNPQGAAAHPHFPWPPKMSRNWSCSF